MANTPPLHIQRAFLQPVVRVNRRLEIYEQDGKTPWRRDLWTSLLVGGSVSVDYERDERRSIDLELDNSYGDLNPEAGGLWYDKVFKLYYGIDVGATERGVRVAIVEQYQADGQAFALKQALSRGGVTEVHYLPSASTYEQIQEYDVLVSISGTSTQKAAFLTQCYNRGKSVITFTMDQTAASLPLVVGNAGGAPVIDGATRRYAAVAGASDLSVGWDEWSTREFPQSQNLVTWGGQGFEDFPLGFPGAGHSTGTIIQVSEGSSGAPTKVYNTPSAGAFVSSPALFTANVTAGEVYYFETWVRKTTTGVTGRVALVRRTTEAGLANPNYSQIFLNMSDMVQNQWHKMSGLLTIGSGKTLLNPYVQVGSDIPAGDVIQWDEVYVKKVLPQDYYRKVLAPATGAQTIAAINDTQGESVGAIARDDGDRRWVHVVQSNFEEDNFVDPEDYDSFAGFVSRAVQWSSTYDSADTWEMQIGEYLADAISDGGSYSTIRITGRDLTKLAINSKLASSTTFSKSTSIEAIVKALASNAGITKHKIPVTKKVLDKDTTWERGTSRWEIIKEVCNTNNHEVFMDHEGYLVVREYLDPLLSPTSLSLSGGVGGNLISRGARTSDSKLINHIVVVGESSDSNVPPSYAEAINNDPKSPTSIQELGDRVEVITSALVTTVSKAQELANSLLAVSALEEFELSFESTLLPWVEPGEIIDMSKSDSRYWGPDRYLLTSLTLPLDLSPMSGNGKRIEKVGVNDEPETAE
ncbi:minor tail protein [Gordonia phage Teatealatte]|uniref:Minor tail protein n=2 Tax=Demosthenesvirus katyusha TaxID=1982108 RepID=A0A345MCG0_9CAUD|nr:minor tail protein [Gordonia phage Teatealatte]QBP29586.1 minor tail protein [Gordonia phage Tredge]